MIPHGQLEAHPQLPDSTAGVVHSVQFQQLELPGVTLHDCLYSEGCRSIRPSHEMHLIVRVHEMSEHVADFIQCSLNDRCRLTIDDGPNRNLQGVNIEHSRLGQALPDHDRLLSHLTIPHLFSREIVNGCIFLL